MNANELADKLMSNLTMEYDCDKYMEQAATMLRKQAEEIEYWKDKFNKAMQMQEPVSKAKDRFSNYESICLQCGITIYKPQFKTLTDEEINKLWAKSHEDGIAMQHGFTTQQHYFAHLILRKAQEK